MPTYVRVQMGGWMCSRVSFCWPWNASQNSKLQGRFLDNNSPSHRTRWTLLICSPLAATLPAWMWRAPLFKSDFLLMHSFLCVFRSRSDVANVTHSQSDVKKARESMRAVLSAAMACLSVHVSRMDVVFHRSESAAAAVGGSKTLKARLCAPALL